MSSKYYICTFFKYPISHTVNIDKIKNDKIPYSPGAEEAIENLCYFILIFKNIIWNYCKFEQLHTYPFFPM